MPNDQRDYLRDLVQDLKRQRDELAVQIHLGRKEAQEEWEKVQTKLNKLLADYEPLRQAIEQSADNVYQSLRLVAGEVMEGFHRVRHSLRKDSDRS